MSVAVANECPFAILESLEYGSRFFTTVDGRDELELTKSGDGQVWYKVLGYAKSVEEAQKMLGYSQLLSWRVAAKSFV